jgi:hypothetical protein
MFIALALPVPAWRVPGNGNYDSWSFAQVNSPCRQWVIRFPGCPAIMLALSFNPEG